MRWWFIGLAMACGTGSDDKADDPSTDETDETDTDTDTDADSDSDSDADSDSDTDADADTDSDTDTDVTLPVITCRPELADCLADVLKNELRSTGERPVSTSVQTYTSCGLIATQDTDEGIDGTIDTAYVYTYDADNYQTSVQFTLTFDEYGPILGGISYTYNPDGTIATFGQDFDGDGIPETTTTMIYDGNGVLIESVFSDGTTSIHTTFVVTGDDTAGTITTDRGDDGQIDAIQTHARTPTLMELWIDDDADGTWDEYQRFTFDGDGRLVTFDRDIGDDGAFDYLLTNTYDAAGRMNERITDQDGDGTINLSETWTWDCP